MLKSINNFNLYIKTDTKNNTEPDNKNNTKKKDTKNNTKPDTKNNSEPDSKNNTKKKDTKNNTEPDTKNNTKPDTKNKIKPYTKDDIESNINDIRASMRENQITVKNRYIRNSLLETEKTIRNNILVYSGLKKLPSESHSKANELIKLGTILNDSINVIQREIHERDKKVMKKIDKNKIKTVDSFIYELKAIIN